MKPGVKAKHHGVIYENSPGNFAQLRQDEPDLGFLPIRARTTASDMESLSAESRVNYSKIVTVEHNVKVRFVGEVLAEDWPIAADAVRKCFG